MFLAYFLLGLKEPFVIFAAVCLVCLGCERSVVVGSSDLCTQLILFDKPAALVVSRILVVVLDKCVIYLMHHFQVHHQ